jgi:hypothetical protein
MVIQTGSLIMAIEDIRECMAGIMGITRHTEVSAPGLMSIVDITQP